MATTSTSFHMDSDSDVKASVLKHDDHNVSVRFGTYECDVTVFIPKEFFPEFAKNMHSALNEAHALLNPTPAAVLSDCTEEWTVEEILAREG